MGIRGRMGLSFWVGAVALAVSCGGDDGVCELGTGTGCADGQLCQNGPDGEPACFCNPDELTGCGDGLECQAVDGGTPDCFCSPRGQTGCAAGEVCEEVVDGNSACFPPVYVRGLVFDLTDDSPVEGALVVARDANNVAVSDVGATDANGNYEITVLTKRNADGSLAENFVTLRADASGYRSYPTPPRFAVPFDTANASGDPLALESSATEIALLPLENTGGLGTVSGTVVADRPRGTLVVAGGATGIADFDGSYTVFNVPAGNVSVDGYLVGVQLAGTTADVAEDQATEGIDLVSSGEATAKVSGKIEIVNPGNGGDTSIIFVVEDTFIESIASGQAPPGLRAYPVSGDFAIEGVPDGDYVVLAAFENDFLVRDPDTSIGGTDIVKVTVDGSSVTIPESFKVTGSLDDVSPDAEEPVSGAPTFVFSDDSSEDHYEIEVYDVYGSLVWSKDDVPGVSGSATVSVPYEGPPLTSGLLYQFRATSIKKNGTPISRSEDLRGVFLYQ